MGVCSLAVGLAWVAGVLLRLLALAAGLATRPVWRKVKRPGRRRAWAASSGMVLYALTLRISAALAWMDWGRIRRLTRTPIETEPWPTVPAGLPLPQRQRAWLESPVIRRRALYQLVRLPVIVASWGRCRSSAC